MQSAWFPETIGAVLQKDTVTGPPLEGAVKHCTLSKETLREG